MAQFKRPPYFANNKADFQIRQRGGIGSAAFDPEQRDIREFFGGARARVTNGEDIMDNA
jgi:hypothetical protein